MRIKESLMNIRDDNLCKMTNTMLATHADTEASLRFVSQAVAHYLTDQTTKFLKALINIMLTKLCKCLSKKGKALI